MQLGLQPYPPVCQVALASTCSLLEQHLGSVLSRIIHLSSRRIDTINVSLNMGSWFPHNSRCQDRVCQLPSRCSLLVLQGLEHYTAAAPTIGARLAAVPSINRRTQHWRHKHSS
jgi:hypothetical protein